MKRFALGLLCVQSSHTELPHLYLVLGMSTEISFHQAIWPLRENFEIQYGALNILQEPIYTNTTYIHAHLKCLCLAVLMF